MSAKRKSIGKRLRFEIFARDGFKCRYCGRSPESVQLVLDHMTPVCRGGDAVPENLITSCFDCNAGKAGKMIEQHVPSDDDVFRRHQELREQEAALELSRKIRLLREAEQQDVVNAICKAIGFDSIDIATARILTSYWRQHGIILFEWIEIAGMHGVPPRTFGRYVSGIRRRWIEENNASEAAQV